MAWKLVDGVYIKYGCYLEPISSTKIDRDSYILANKILDKRLEHYRQDKRKVLLMPLMRGGSRPFNPLSGVFRSVLGPKNIDYVGIKTFRYDAVNKEAEMQYDETDIRQALEALEECCEGVIVDDIFDRGITTEKIKSKLAESNKTISIAVLYRKPEANKTAINTDFWVQDYFRKKIAGEIYMPWLVFPWEIDEHEPELWRDLYPEFWEVSIPTYLFKTS